MEDRSSGSLPRNLNLGLTRNSVDPAPMPMVALLGRRDQPTDAVEDYCRYLGEALERLGVALLLVRMPWLETGWPRSLYWLWHKSKGWKGHWVMVQYTALGWSRHGVPPLFLVVLFFLRIRNTRIAVVFHDPEPYAGSRFVDKVRRICQRWMMRCTYWLADNTILTIPVKDVSWLRPVSEKATFIPVGANISPVVTPILARNGGAVKTIVVFGITGGGRVGNEVLDIAFAARAAAKQVPGIRLVTLGRGSAESESKFRLALEGSAVEYNALGILSAEEVCRVLCNSDVSLFVRGPISTQRGSAIASIACALPLIAYANTELAAPLCEAGLVPVPCGDREGLAEATVKVLTDRKLWLELHQRSRIPYEKYFSWEAVASRFVELFNHA